MRLTRLSRQIAGQATLVTGAARRMGRATALLFADEGARVAAVDHRRVPLRRYGDPEEVAHMTLSLALPAASFVNGAVLVVDGGLTAQNT